MDFRKRFKLYKQYIHILVTSILFRSPTESLLTLGVVVDKQHGTLPDDAPHGVGVLDVAHEQLLVQEHSGGEVAHLLRTHKPRPSEPRVITVKKGYG